jgi:hypothetical protein
MTMKTCWKTVLLVAMVGATGSVALAGETKGKQAAGTATESAAAKAGALTPAQLRARMLRVEAALLEAQAAEAPDAQKVDKLRKQLQALRAKLSARAPAAPFGGRGAGICPWGGPGLGLGPAWGGPRRGLGGGWGGGVGWGRGCGYVDADNDGICDYFEARHGF